MCIYLVNMFKEKKLKIIIENRNEILKEIERIDKDLKGLNSYKTEIECKLNIKETELDYNELKIVNKLIFKLNRNLKSYKEEVQLLENKINKINNRMRKDGLNGIR